MEIKDKVVFITGGASGIGLVTAERLSKEGAKIAVYSHDADKIDKSKGFLVFEGDICDRERVKEAIAETIKKFGSLDILINNAGVAQRKDFIKTTETDWDLILDVNLKGTFTVTQEAIKTMRNGSILRTSDVRNIDNKFNLGTSDVQRLRNERLIINISSGAGLYGIEGLSVYSAAKAGLIAFTQALAEEINPFGIKVVAITPGSTDTKMFREAFPNEKPQHTPEQVAEVIYKTIIGEIKPDDRLVVDVFYHTR